MKSTLRLVIIVSLLCFLSNVVFGQAPNLGSTLNFVLFATDGAVNNTGISHFSGSIGSDKGAVAGFGNVNGVMHNVDAATATANVDLASLYYQLDTVTAHLAHAPALGNGETLTPGVYAIPSAATLDLKLILNAGGNSNAVFIFKVKGPLSSTALSEVQLLNGAQACNVFWKIEGLVSLASGTIMKGSIVANNAAIDMQSGSSLEGRALSTSGAITINGVSAYTPVGCGSAYLTGPVAPTLASTENFALFSSNGSVSNSGLTVVKGDIGTNVGLASGFDALNVNGLIHPIPDGFTAACAADLVGVYNYLNTLSADIELLFPAQFGHNLVLTPHVYLLNAATVLTDTIYLNGQGNADAVFVLKIKGAFSTSTLSKVLLTNGTQAKNIFWCVDGFVDINDYSVFAGTIICNNGAITLKTGVNLDGRALTTSGAFATSAATVSIPSGGVVTSIQSLIGGKITLSVVPNPFSTYTTFCSSNDLDVSNCEVLICNAWGQVVIAKTISTQMTTLDTSHLPSGIYLYRVIQNNQTIQCGKLVCKQ